jgi:mannose-1-phosphate guanylyltransferase
MVILSKVLSKIPFAIVIVGGKSTRFYPMGSKIFGTQGVGEYALPVLSNYSLFEYRLQYLHQVVEHIVVVGGEDFRSIAERQSLQSGIPIHFVAEISPRGTAPAYLLGLSYIATHWPDCETSLVLLTPSDHIHRDPRVFNESVLQAARLVQERGKIATFVVKPRFPSDGFSYLLPMSSVDPEVRCFVQKPTQQEARILMEQGASWGLGVHLGELHVLRTAILQHEAIVDDAEVSVWWSLLTGQINLEGGIFCRLTSELIIVDVTDSGWSDVGTVEELLRLLPHDDFENAFAGTSLYIKDCRRCRIINASTVPLTVDGLSDMVIALSKEFRLLVVPIGESESIRHYLESPQRIVADSGSQVLDGSFLLQRALVVGRQHPVSVTVGTEGSVRVSPDVATDACC